MAAPTMNALHNLPKREYHIGQHDPLLCARCEKALRLRLTDAVREAREAMPRLPHNLLTNEPAFAIDRTFIEDLRGHAIGMPNLGNTVTTMIRMWKQRYGMAPFNVSIIATTDEAYEVRFRPETREYRRPRLLPYDAWAP